MRWKEGDKVKVKTRNQLLNIPDVIYQENAIAKYKKGEETIFINPVMEKKLGKTFTIKDVAERSYTLEEVDWVWAEWMLTHV